MPKRRRTKRMLENIRFGIEIEVEFPEAKDSSKLIEKHRIIRGWAMDFDGSLDNGAEYRPKDRNKLYYNEDSIDQIKEIIGLIKAHRGTIRPSCGLHIHVDMSQFSNKEIMHIIKAFVRHQKYLYQKFNVLKSREEYTTLKLPKSVLRDLKEEVIHKIKSENMINSRNEYFTDRHFGLNMQSLSEHGTLEFRLFNGTIQVGRIKEYIKYVINFCLINAKGRK